MKNNKKRQYEYPFQNPNLPIERRIDNIISLMTMEEKLMCLSTRIQIPRLGIEGTHHVEGMHGLAIGGPGNWGGGFPIPTTQFPQAIGMAETWDPGLIQKAGAVEGLEARYIYHSKKYKRGALVIRAPIGDLGRDPRWGRTEECFGEDPFLVGTMAVAFIKGMQGSHPEYLQTASLMKHFLANSNEDDRGKSSSDFDQRLFREYYSVGFRMGFQDGKAKCYMAAYNAYNGIPCTVHPVLKKVTVDEWGVDGIICTDGQALKFLISDHQYYPDLEMGAAAAIKYGIVQFLDRYPDAVRGALKNNLITEKDIDKAMRGSFRIMIRLGLLDPPGLVPYTKVKDDGKDPWETEKHKSLARQVAEKSIVLLKNENKLLPLNKKSIKSIAVIGSRADEVLPEWYSGTPGYTIAPLEGIKAKSGKNIKIAYALDNQNREAEKIAKESDIAIICVGNHPTGNAGWAECPEPSDGKEAVDRKSITLKDEEMIKQIFRVNPNTIVVLISSFPFAITWTRHNIPAILHMTHCCQELGNALANVLFGDINPAGRLVQTWPRSIEQLPPMMDYNIRNGRTYMYFKGEPLYAFGFGLSYTEFKYSNLTVSSDKISGKNLIAISIDVKNTGQMDGDEVIQMYIRHLNSSVERPFKELKGFQRIKIKKGETKKAKMQLKGEAIAYWDEGKNRWAIEEGKIEILVGASSDDIRVSSIINVSP